MKSIFLFHRPFIGFAFVAAVVLGGCASTTPLNPADVETRQTPSDNLGGAAGSRVAPVPQSAVTGVDMNNGAGANLPAGASRTVYFDFDSFVVQDVYRSVIENNAKVLATNKQRRVMVEGHTDERGGREYNLALGQKRAEAVVRSLTLLGAQDAQIEAVSFGKEKPAVSGSSEEAWAKNRRAEIKDR